MGLKIRFGSPMDKDLFMKNIPFNYYEDIEKSASYIEAVLKSLSLD